MKWVFAPDAGSVPTRSRKEPDRSSNRRCPPGRADHAGGWQCDVGCGGDGERRASPRTHCAEELGSSLLLTHSSPRERPEHRLCEQGPRLRNPGRDAENRNPQVCPQGGPGRGSRREGQALRCECGPEPRRKESLQEDERHPAPGCGAWSARGRATEAEPSAASRPDSFPPDRSPWKGEGAWAGCRVGTRATAAWGGGAGQLSLPGPGREKKNKNLFLKTAPNTATASAPRLVGPKKQLAAFNLGTYVNEVGN